MKTFTITRKFLWIFPCHYTFEKPRIMRVTGADRLRLVWAGGRSNPMPWRCIGNGYTGYGRTPAEAWNEWANWVLI